MPTHKPVRIVIETDKGKFTGIYTSRSVIAAIYEKSYGPLQKVLPFDPEVAPTKIETVFKLQKRARRDIHNIYRDLE